MPAAGKPDHTNVRRENLAMISPEMSKACDSIEKRVVPAHLPGEFNSRTSLTCTMLSPLKYLR